MSLTKNEQPVTVSLAGNPMWVDYSTDQTAQDFIGIHYSLYAYLNDAYTLLGGEMRYEPDSTGKAQVDIHSLLEWDPEHEFSWPEKVNEILVKRNDLRRKFKVEVSEKYGNPLAQDSTDTISDLYVLPGKISDIAQAIINDAESTWYADQAASKKFLTNAPREKTTDAWSSERLFFLLTSAPDEGTVKMNVRITYSDGSSMNIVRQTINDAAQYDVLELVTSFSTFGLFVYDISKEVSKYDIWLSEDDGTAISEEYTYMLDHIRKPNTRYFLFANSMKMIEGVRMTGVSSNTAAYSYLQSKRTLDKGFGVKDPSNIKSNSKEIEYMETSSGWMSLDEMNWLRELLLSTEVYEVVNGKAVPVLIESNSIYINSDNSNLRALTFKYIYGHKDRVPGIIPEYSDGISDFKSDEVNVGDVNDSGVSQFQFANFNYDNATGEFSCLNMMGDKSTALSANEFTNNYIPYLIHFWDIDGTEQWCDLVAAMVDSSDIDSAECEEVPLTFSPDNGFGILFGRSSTGFKLAIINENGIGNRNEGFFKLYYATKRYLEYLYENK